MDTNDKAKKDVEQAQLILLLHEGMIKFSNEGKDAIIAKDTVFAHDRLIRAQNIALELLYSIDRKKGGTIAENLVMIYNHCYQLLVEANIKQDSSKIDDCNEVIKPLRNNWEKAVKTLSVAAGKDPDV